MLNANNPQPDLPPTAALATAGSTASKAIDIYMGLLKQELDNSLIDHQGAKFIVFTSSGGGEGVTTVVSQLAGWIHRNGRLKIAVLDFGGNGAAGKMLQAIEKDKVSSTSFNHDDIAGGTLFGTLHPGDFHYFEAKGEFEGREIQPLADYLKSNFDYILVDTPSLRLSAWSLTLAPYAAGIVLVTRAEHTRWPIVAESVTRISAVNTRFLGVFLNRRLFHIPNSIYQVL